MIRDRNQRSFWAILFVLLIGVVNQANAQTAEEMKSNCETISSAAVLPDGQVALEQTFASGVCWGSFGTLQILSTYVDSDRTPILKFCPPRKSTLMQFVQTFSKYADRHPEDQDKNWNIVAQKALLEAFPCP